jgi:Cd2+/Zn2+-exporting ATPase
MPPALRIGQTVLVRPGDRIPADGEMVDGISGIDESAGHRRIRTQDARASATPSLPARSTARRRCACASTAAEDNTIARIVRLVEEAQEAKAPTERFIDRFSRIYMPAIVGLALLVALLPPLLPAANGRSGSIGPGAAADRLPLRAGHLGAGRHRRRLSAGARRGLLMKGGAVIEAGQDPADRRLRQDRHADRGRPRVTDIVPMAAEPAACWRWRPRSRAAPAIRWPWPSWSAGEGRRRRAKPAPRRRPSPARASPASVDGARSSSAPRAAEARGASRRTPHRRALEAAGQDRRGA